MKKFVTLLSIFLIIPIAYTYPTDVDAQTQCSNEIAGKSRAQLEAELEACNKEIAQWTAELNKTRQQSASYERDVSALTARINAAQANIRSRNIAINNISNDINNKQAQIKTLGERIEINRQAIADILRKKNDIGSYSIAEVVLSNKNFSEFFVDIDTYAMTGRALNTLLDELGNTRKLTEAEKIELDRKREAEATARAQLEASRKEVEIAQRERQTLLAASRSQERTYEQVVAERQARAAQIRATLFPLRDSGAIPFGTALQFAEAASARTGVRPALILAILQQESAMGANVGTCIISDLNSGQTKHVSNGTVFRNGIHPTRDLPLVQSLLSTLGRDPLNTRVSCPVSHTFGYGGAMGPAQFIPSTWNIVRNAVASAVGKTTADPWSPQDSIMAAAILLRDNGAASKTYEAERNAACRYYSGRVCSALSAAATYGNQVMQRTNNIQLTMIDPLQGL